MNPLILAVPAGIAVGGSLGALGAGGSILTVPVLVYLLGRSAHQATTMSLVIVGATALVGAIAHARAGRVRLGPGLVFGLLGAAGSVLGTRLGAHLNPNVLLLAFAGLMLAAAGAMLTRSRRGGGSADSDRHGRGGSGRDGSAEGRGVDRGSRDGGGDSAGVDSGRADSGRGASARTHRSGVVKIIAAASAVGLLTGFFGVGGGFVVVPVLVLLFGYETATAIGTSLVVIAVNSAAALVARLGGHGAFGGPLLAVFLFAAVAGALLGKHYAAGLDPRRLGTAFSLVLVALAVYMSVRSLTGLL